MKKTEKWDIKKELKTLLSCAKFVKSQYNRIDVFATNDGKHDLCTKEMQKLCKFKLEELSMGMSNDYKNKLLMNQLFKDRIKYFWTEKFKNSYFGFFINYFQ